MKRLIATIVAGVLLLAACFAACLPAWAGEVVPFGGGYRPGSIVIVTHARELFFVLGSRRAIRYPVGVGRAGMAWHGQARVAEKYLHPAWRDPPSINGGHYGPIIPGGSPRNPMGAAVLGLDRGNYTIHGTNNPDSVGRFVSHGCIRLHNADIMDLYARAAVGTDVYVLQ